MNPPCDFNAQSRRTPPHPLCRSIAPARGCEHTGGNGYKRSEDAATSVPMTRHRTFRPRGTRCECAVCDAALGPGEGRARCDYLGQMLCEAHGHQARRYAERKLLERYPNLLVLFAARKDLTFVCSYLHPTVLGEIVRFPPSESTTKCPCMLPFHVAGGKYRQPRRTVKRPRPAHCGLCNTKFSDDGRRSGTRPWGNDTVCRACHVRLMRQHRRAGSQFDAIVQFVRCESGAWLLPLLDPKLAVRLTKYLSRTTARPRAAHDPDRWV